MPKRIIEHPKFCDMRPAQVMALLKRNHVGRIAFSFHDRVDMRPIHYAYSNGWLFGRTSPSDKLITLRHSPWVAFETDEVSGSFDWASVVVRGTFYRLTDEGTSDERLLYRRALRQIRTIDHGALTEADVVPFRSELFGIAIDEATGRSCSSKPNSSSSESDN